MADYTAEQLRGHTIRIEGEPGHIQGYELHIYDETDKQVIDNVKCVGLSLTPTTVNIAHVLLEHIDPTTKQRVEEHVDVAEAQLEVSFSAQAYDCGFAPPGALDGQVPASELRSCDERMFPPTHPISSLMWQGALSHAGETLLCFIEKSLAKELRSQGALFEKKG